MSSVDLPSIQTNFAPYSTSSTAASRSYHSTSPCSPSPAMTFQSRSYSTSSASSLLSTYSSSSDRSLSVSPGPATPCDMMSRSPSFSHDSIYNKPSLPNLQHKQHPHYPSYPPSSSHPSSPSLLSAQRYTSSSSVRHHPYQTVQHHQKQYYQSDYQERSSTFHHSSTYRPLLSPSSPRDMFSTHSSSRSHGDYHPSYHHQQQQQYQQQSQQQQQQTHQQRSPYSSHQVDCFHSRSPTIKTSPSFNSAFAYHSAYPMMTPKEEERESSYMHSMTPHQHHHARASSSSLLKEEEDDEEDDDRSEYAPSMSHSPSMSQAGSSFSRESTPLTTSDRLGSMSEASDSMTSLVSSSSSTGSMTPVPTTTQLLLCPVCSRAFKPSKNQNCNLRRHLKNVHNMSPTMHPRKCKWDSLPDGRVKDDKDRKERTRKSKRLWARKFRLRRKVEEAAVVLSMLSQAV